MIRSTGTAPALDTLDLCCGGKKCPMLTDVGDEIVVSDPVQTPAQIRIAKDDVPRVIAWLKSRTEP